MPIFIRERMYKNTLYLKYVKENKTAEIHINDNKL
jgi:ribosomal protein S17